jgi:hypothetical protein
MRKSLLTYASESRGLAIENDMGFWRWGSWHGEDLKGMATQRRQLDRSF